MAVYPHRFARAVRSATPAARGGAASFDAAAFDAFLAQQAAALRAAAARGLAEAPAAVLAQRHRELAALPWDRAPRRPHCAVACPAMCS